MVRGTWTVALAALGLTCAAQEICDNGLDDDGNGLIDLNDPACVCSGGSIDPGVASFIPNPSFEINSALPGTFAQLALATGWQQATIGTTDYLHTAGFTLPNLPLPLPDGDGCAGFIISKDSLGRLGGINGTHYLEYLGANLTQPLPAGSSHTLQCHVAATSVISDGSPTTPDLYFGPIALTVFGLPAPATFPSMALGVDCPMPTWFASGWMELGHALVQPQNAWSVISIHLTAPVDIHAVMIGAPCEVPASYQVQGDPVLDPTIVQPYFFIDQLVLNQSTLFTNAIARSGALCTNDLLLTGQPASGATAHQWYRDGIALSGQTGLTLAVSALGLGTGDYQFRALLNDGCAVASITIALDGLQIAASGTPSACTSATGTATLTAQQGAIATAVWSNGSTGTAVQGLAPGTYSVTASDAFGCSSSTTVSIVQISQPTATAFATDSVLAPGGSTQLVALGGGSYAWSPSAGLSCTDCAAPIATPASTTTYCVTVSDANLCSDTACVTVRVVVPEAPCDVFVPNAFSPDESGANDKLCLYGPCIASVSFTIRDRWGRAVFTTSDTASCWDGTYRNEPLNPGVFVYQLEATLFNDERITRGGNITLFR